MKERPIIFSGPMVRAIIEGRKTQTRRVVESQPTVDPDGSLHFPWATFFPNGHVHTWDRSGCGGENWMAQHHPNENKFEQALRRTPYANPCPYGEPGDRLVVKEAESNHITLEVVSVRVERLQAISEADKLAEGATPDVPFGTAWRKINIKPGIRWEDNPWVWVVEFKKLEAP